MENLEIKDKIAQLQSFLPEKSKEELEQILAYGEKIKERGKKEKKKFWSNADRDVFLKLLNYRLKHQKEIESEYRYLDKMTEIEREKFMEEYLCDDILYHGKLDKEKLKSKRLRYGVWKEGDLKIGRGDRLDFDMNQLGDEQVKKIATNIQLEEGVELNLDRNEFGVEGAEAVSKMELKEGVHLNLSDNEIGDKGVVAIAGMNLKEGVALGLNNTGFGVKGAEALSKMELKEGVQLDLGGNEIGAEGAKIIAQNMKLKEGVILNLNMNDIGDEGAEAIMEKMELKNGVNLFLSGNNLSDEMKQKLRVWGKSYHDQGIKCEVVIG